MGSERRIKMPLEPFAYMALRTNDLNTIALM